MKRFLLALIPTLSAVAALAALTPAPSGNPSAHGNYVRSNGTIISFSVLKKKDGTVTGSLYSQSATGFIFTVDYDDLTFSADGKSAYLHGHVTYANLNPSLVGHESYQKVTDNGEGSKDPADKVSAIFQPVGAVPNYEAFLDGLTQLAIVDGNIQVLAH